MQQTTRLIWTFLISANIDTDFMYFFFLIKKTQIFLRVGAYYNILGSCLGSVHPELLHTTSPKSTLNITREWSHFPQPLLFSAETGHLSLPPCTSAFSDTLTQETPLFLLPDPVCWLCSNDSHSTFPGELRHALVNRCVLIPQQKII